MVSEVDWQRESLVPMAALLGQTKEHLINRLDELMAERGFERLRFGHGCVFRFIEAEGSRLTDLAARSGFTKQAVGEVATELEQLGYIERFPDPADKRVKIIRLTERGDAARSEALRTFYEIEREWADRIGAERVANLRATLEEIAGTRSPHGNG